MFTRVRTGGIRESEKAIDINNISNAMDIWQWVANPSKTLDVFYLNEPMKAIVGYISNDAYARNKYFITIPGGKGVQYYTLGKNSLIRNLNLDGYMIKKSHIEALQHRLVLNGPSERKNSKDILEIIPAPCGLKHIVAQPALVDPIINIILRRHLYAPNQNSQDDLYILPVHGAYLDSLSGDVYSIVDGFSGTLRKYLHRAEKNLTEYMVYYIIFYLIYAVYNFYGSRYSITYLSLDDIVYYEENSPSPKAFYIPREDENGYIIDTVTITSNISFRIASNFVSYATFDFARGNSVQSSYTWLNKYFNPYDGIASVVIAVLSVENPTIKSVRDNIVSMVFEGVSTYEALFETHRTKSRGLKGNTETYQSNVQMSSIIKDIEKESTAEQARRRFDLYNNPLSDNTAYEELVFGNYPIINNIVDILNHIFDSLRSLDTKNTIDVLGSSYLSTFTDNPYILPSVDTINQVFTAIEPEFKLPSGYNYQGSGIIRLGEPDKIFNGDIIVTNYLAFVPYNYPTYNWTPSTIQSFFTHNGKTSITSSYDGSPSLFFRYFEVVMNLASLMSPNSPYDVRFDGLHVDVFNYLYPYNEGIAINISYYTSEYDPVGMYLQRLATYPGNTESSTPYYYESNVPIPPLYEEYYGIIAITDDGLYIIPRKDIMGTRKDPAYLKILSSARYIAEGGPMLISNGEIIMNEDLINKEVDIEGKKVRIFQSMKVSNSSDKIVKPSMGYVNGFFTYISTEFYVFNTITIAPGELGHSSNSNPRTVLIQRQRKGTKGSEKDTLTILQVEGRDYGGFGVELVFLTKFIKERYPDVVNALNVDGGSSATLAWRSAGRIITPRRRFRKAVGNILSVVPKNEMCSQVMGGSATCNVP